MAFFHRDFCILKASVQKKRQFLDSFPRFSSTMKFAPIVSTWDPGTLGRPQRGFGAELPLGAQGLLGWAVGSGDLDGEHP